MIARRDKAGPVIVRLYLLNYYQIMDQVRLMKGHSVPARVVEPN
jgi:hypothetical protein